jgi:hypothetical protein
MNHVDNGEKKRKNWKNAYAVYSALTILLCGLFFYIFWLTAPKDIVEGISTGEAVYSDLNPVKLYERNAEYNVLEDFRKHNPTAVPYDFPKLPVTKSKLSKGFQLVVKSPNAHILGEYRSKDMNKMVDFVQRSYIDGTTRWNQVDAVITDPASAKFETVPVSYTYGNWQEQIAAGNMMLGFTDDDSFLLLSTRTEGEDLVYTVASCSLTNQRMTPLMDVSRVSPSQTSTSYIVSGWITSDSKHLMLKDNHDIIMEYSLKDGAKVMEFTPPAEGHPNGNYIASSVKDVIFYVAEHYQPTAWLIDAAHETKSQPFLNENGYVDPGFDTNSQVIYYNFTYDRSTHYILKDDDSSLLTAKGVQIMDMNGKPIRRFALATDSPEFLEFAGYIKDKNIVILHKYTVGLDSNGHWYKQTVDWLTGDLNTGEMISLIRLNVPDRWDTKNVFFTTVVLDGNPDSYIHCFINLQDGTYYLPKWKNREIMKNQDQDLILYTDEKNQRVYSRSFTRPDLGVSLLNFKKYNFKTTDFKWLTGGFLAHVNPYSDGLRLYFIQVSP